MATMEGGKVEEVADMRLNYDRHLNGHYDPHAHPQPHPHAHPQPTHLVHLLTNAPPYGFNLPKIPDLDFEDNGRRHPAFQISEDNSEKQEKNSSVVAVAKDIFEPKPQIYSNDPYADQTGSYHREDLDQGYQTTSSNEADPHDPHKSDPEYYHPPTSYPEPYHPPTSPISYHKPEPQPEPYHPPPSPISYHKPKPEPQPYHPQTSPSHEAYHPTSAQYETHPLLHPPTHVPSLPYGPPTYDYCPSSTVRFLIILKKYNEIIFPFLIFPDLPFMPFLWTLCWTSD
jgi:hypothetical protein